MTTSHLLPFKKIILGSGSPRRKQLLEGLGWPVTVIKKDVDETIVPGLNGETIAMLLAEKKAKAFDGKLSPDELLITADTIVCLEHQVLGKPVDRNDAISMLKRLQGNTHQVFTGVCLTIGAKRHYFAIETAVTFHPLSDSAIESYIDHYQPYDKAGAYGAQETLSPGINPLSEKELYFLSSVNKPKLFQETLAIDQLKQVPIIASINGSYFNVMGLPLAELWDELKNFAS